MLLPILALTQALTSLTIQLPNQDQQQAQYQVLASNLLDGLNKSQFDSVESNFGTAMQNALPADKLRAVWIQITGQYGKYKGIDTASTKDVPPYHVVTAVCNFDSGKLDATISFDSAGLTQGIFFSPDSDPIPVASIPPGLTGKELVVGEGSKWPLPATLTLPAGKGPFAALVLVHGSGPEDRDETIGPNKPFRDIAWGLAQHGIAVLRYEKRTKQYASQLAASPGSFTVDDETVDDAVAAVGVLEKRPEIEHSRIFVLGHSLGGMMIPRIASRTPNAGGYIIFAGPCEPIERLILEQYKTRLAGQKTPEALSTIASMERAVAIIDSPELTASTPESEIMNVPASYWLDLRGYNPTTSEKSIHKPLLIMQGAADIQVPGREFELWKAQLGSTASYKLYPGLSHLFMPNQFTVSDYSVANHVDATVIDDIANWINGQHG